MIDYSSVIVSSRVRLARNFSDTPFPNKIKSQESAKSVIYRVFKLLPSYENYLVSDLSLDTLNSLKEKHLISEDLTQNVKFGALSLSHDEQVCIMINEEEHLREQCLLKGFMLDEALAMLNEVDDLLLENLPIAFDDSLGFITTCPSNLGTGLRASVMLFLPALTLTNSILGLIDSLGKIGLTVRGQYGENSEADAYMFQVSNSQTLGLSEQQIIQNVKTAVIKICEKELYARQSLINSNFDELKDRVLRAYGTLKYAYKLCLDEATKLLSVIKLGVCLDIINNIKLTDLDNLIEDILPSTLKLLYGEDIDQTQLDKFRAKYIQQKI